MLSKRIFGTLLITAMIIISTTVTQAQSTDRKPWPRGSTVNNQAPDQTAERAPAAETQPALREWQSADNCGFLCIIERQKTAIVGSWLGTIGDGSKLLVTFNSDGTAHGSVQGEVSTNPELGVLTPTHGVWKHLGGRQFAFTVWGILYDINTGHLNGYAKIRGMLKLNETGDEVSGRDKVEILDPHGNVVETLPSGDFSYKRIKFEPFD